MDDLNKLRIVEDDGGTFTDYTEKAWDFGRAGFETALDADTLLYIGRSKKFNAAFIEFTTPGATEGAMTIEYWNGTAWTALEPLSDDTLGFSQSGFIKWTTPENWAAGSDEASLPNSATNFWLRVSFAAEQAVNILGINLVFANDADLRTLNYQIDDFRPKDQAGNQATTHILTHVAAREEILQELVRSGVVKQSSAGRVMLVDQWDFFDVNQLRKAAQYLALSMIFFSLSDQKDDMYWLKHKEYEGKYKSAMNLAILSLDYNNDGEESAAEASAGAPQATLVR